MENKNDNRTLIQIYAIHKNLEYEEVNNITVSENGEVLYWVKRFSVPHGRWTWYTYECFTSDGTHIPFLQKNGWKTEVFNTHGDAENIIFKGLDPMGRSVQKGTGNRIAGVINTIRFLDELSQFKSWEQYQLLKENEELQSKLELLIAERNKLQANLDNPD